MISQESIYQITQAARIEEVVGWFVSLKKRGTSLIGLCPFHNEKSPSFNVNISRGIFKCFGCGKGGDSLQFLMEHEKFSYPEALKFLADKYNIPIEESINPETYSKENDNRESLYILNQYAKDHFKINLNSEEGFIGKNYFIERGFREDTLEKFELGFSFSTKSFFSDRALEYGFKSEFLIKSGLAILTENGQLLDRFRGRVIFPIHNQSGKVIAFGGRILKSADKTAKYINSPETEFYQKSEVLYGLFQAKNTIRSLDRCLLAEGYTDVISLSQSGIENVVSSSGTSLTKGQIKLISRFTENVTILYDGDSAGIKASLRGIDLLLEEGLKVKIVLFPDNQDPDSYIRKVGGTAFSDYIHKNEKDFISFKTDLLLAEAKNDPIQKAILVHDILESIAKIPDMVLSSIYTHECSEKLEMDERGLINEINKIRLKKAKSPDATMLLSKSTNFANPGNSLNPGHVANSIHSSLDEILSPSPTQADSGIIKEGHELRNQEMEPPNPGLKDDEQEEELLRLVLNYGNEVKPEGITIAYDIITQIQDIEIENPICKEVLSVVEEQLKQNKKLDLLPLIQSRNPKIRNLTVALLSQKYNLSENWKNRHGIDVKMEEDILSEAVDNCINHLKRRKLDALIKENQNKMKLTKNPEEEAELMSIHLLYSNLRSNLSAALGVVVLK